MSRAQPTYTALRTARCPVVGITAFSGTGKTSLLTRVVPILRARGLHVGIIKHAHHGFDLDQPGKDSFELRKAGAEQMLVASRARWALMVETPETDVPGEDPRLEDMIQRLDQDSLDLILVEGFKHVPFPKIELHRPELGRPLLCRAMPSVIAVAANAPLARQPDIPVLDLDDAESIAGFIVERFVNGGHPVHER
jgi:molybdopterin-guanine dinucleotide biosynthesis protein B